MSTLKNETIEEYSLSESTIKSLIAKFKKQMPDFVDFNNPGKKFVDEEIAYKEKILKKYQTQLGNSKVKQRILNNDGKQLAKELSRCLGNLISWRSAIDGDNASITKILSVILSCSEKEYKDAETLKPIFKTAQELGLSLKWDMLSSLLWLFNPESYFPIKISYFRNFASTIHINLPSKGIDENKFHELMCFGHLFKKTLKPISPRSWIDIQSFIWCLSQPEETDSAPIDRDFRMEQVTAENLPSKIPHMSWFLCITLALLDLEKTTVPLLVEHQILKHKTKDSHVKNVNAICWGQLQTHTLPSCSNVQVKKRSEPCVFWKDDQSFWSVDRSTLQEKAPEIYALWKRLHPPQKKPSVKTPGKTDMQAFIAMPFNPKFFPIWKAIKEACSHNKIKAIRVDQLPMIEDIHKTIFTEIENSDIIIADFSGDRLLSVPNPNVVTEAKHALYKKKPIMILTQSTEALPFDWRTRRAIIYENTVTGLEYLQEVLAENLGEIKKRIGSSTSVVKMETQKYNLGITDSTVVDSAFFKKDNKLFTLKRFSDNKIRIFDQQENMQREAVKPQLRDIISRYNLQVDMLMKTGKEKNTQTLGKDVIGALNQRKRGYDEIDF